MNYYLKNYLTKRAESSGTAKVLAAIKASKKMALDAVQANKKMALAGLIATLTAGAGAGAYGLGAFDATPPPEPSIMENPYVLAGLGSGLGAGVGGLAGNYLGDARLGAGLGALAGTGLGAGYSYYK